MGTLRGLINVKNPVEGPNAEERTDSSNNREEASPPYFSVFNQHTFSFRFFFSSCSSFFLRLSDAHMITIIPLLLTFSPLLFLRLVFVAGRRPRPVPF